MAQGLNIEQDEKGYRFSLDPFLLAQFVESKEDARVIDLGTGNGIIALLLAYKYRCIEITGVELQDSLVEVAKRNVTRNGFGGRIRILKGDIRDVRSLEPARSFEIVVGNPPYRKMDSGRISPSPAKAMARHEVMLPLEDFMGACSYLLTDRGRVNVIYHPQRLAELLIHFHRFKIAPSRMRSVHSRSDSQAVMVLVEGVKNGRNPLIIERPLIIYNDKGKYTEEVDSSFPD